MSMCYYPKREKVNRAVVFLFQGVVDRVSDVMTNDDRQKAGIIQGRRNPTKKKQKRVPTAFISRF